MADEIARIGWDVREMDGALRVSGTETGRRLRYDVRYPAKFNQMVVEKWIKQGKLKDSDVKQVRAPRLIGAAPREVSEYWLTLEAALRIAMEVRTPAAAEVRQRVIEQLQSYQRNGLPAAPLTPPPANDLATTVESAIAARASDIVQMVTQAIGKNLISQLKPLEESIERMHGFHIDRDRRLHLNYRAKLLVKALGKSSVSAIWESVRERHRLRPGRTFETVPRTLFDAVDASLAEQIEDARPATEEVEVDNVVDHPSKVAVAGIRPADTDIDMNPRQVALRLSADLDRPVPAKALTRAGGVYHCATIDPLYENTGRGRKKGEPYLDETRYRALLQFAKTQTRWLDMIIDDDRKGAKG